MFVCMHDALVKWLLHFYMLKNLMGHRIWYKATSKLVLLKHQKLPKFLL